METILIIFSVILIAVIGIVVLSCNATIKRLNEQLYKARQTLLELQSETARTTQRLQKVIGRLVERDKKLGVFRNAKGRFESLKKEDM